MKEKMLSNWDKAKPIIESGNRAVPFVVPPKAFAWLKKAVNKANRHANKTLIGHIKKEYHIDNIDDEFKNFILKDCLANPIIFSHTQRINILSQSCKFYIDDLWVNFQKKHEFNPPHTHSGLYSFVIFVKIPYDLKKEEKCFSDIEENKLNVRYNHTSKFAFLNVDYTGEIRCDLLNVDKSFEGKMIMFPAKQSHQVFPFYTSNDYRITVSGNLKFKVS